MRPVWGNRQFRSRRRGLWGRLRMSEQQLHWRIGLEYQLTRQEPVEDTACGVDVGARIYVDAAQCLLWSDECRRALNHVRHRERRLGVARFVHGLCDTEIENLHEIVILAVAAQKDVRGFDVAMHQPIRVGLPDIE